MYILNEYTNALQAVKTLNITYMLLHARIEVGFTTNLILYLFNEDCQLMATSGFPQTTYMNT